jgi:hypothetical protein
MAKSVADKQRLIRITEENVRNHPSCISQFLTFFRLSALSLFNSFRRAGPAGNGDNIKE